MLVTTLLLTALAAPQDRLALWQKDIDFATVELARRHENLFVHMTKAEWSDSATRAKKELGDTADPARFAVAMMRHVARIGDAHTDFVWGKIGLAVCPIKLDSFAEGVLVVGNATGGKSNHFGELKRLKLPESRLSIYYSSNYFRKVSGDPASLEPDCAVVLHAADYFAGNDPFLDAVFAAAGDPSGTKKH